MILMFFFACVDGVWVILPCFCPFLHPSRAFLRLRGIFPCLGRRKWLKTEDLSFWGGWGECRRGEIFFAVLGKNSKFAGWKE